LGASISISLGYEREWNVIEKIFAILGVVIVIKVVLFILPFFIEALQNLFLTHQQPLSAKHLSVSKMRSH